MYNDILCFCFSLHRLFLDESPTRGLVSRSRSTEALRKISQTSGEPSMSLEQELQEQEYMWQRTHSLSETQKVLDDAIRDIEEVIAQDLANLKRQRHYSSNDSAMGGSEAVVSPVQSDYAHSEPSTLNRKRQVFDSGDSAFSNYSSPTNSSEGVHQNSDALLGGEGEFAVPCNHIRMSSEVSSASATSPVPEQAAATVVSVSQRLLSDTREHSSTSPSPLCKSAETVSSAQRESSSSEREVVVRNASHSTASQPSRHSKKKSKHKSSGGHNSGSGGFPSRITGYYAHQRSPILSPKDHHICLSDTQLDSLSSDHTPTDSTANITSSPSGFSLDSSHLHGSGTVI